MTSTTTEPVFVSAAELRTHKVRRSLGDGRLSDPEDTTDLRGTPIGGQAQVWRFDRMVYPRTNAKRRVRQHVEILHCPEGWHSDSGSAGTPYGTALCQTLMDPKWSTPAGGYDRDRFHAFHDQHPVRWVVKIRMPGRRWSERYCDPELPGEYRTACGATVAPLF